MQPNNPFHAPAPVGGVRPRVRDLAGRMVAFVPTALALNLPGIKAGTFQDRITADVVVFDGGVLEFGGKPEKGIPHTLVISTPCEFTGMYLSQVNMVSALRGSVNAGVVLGRIVQGQTAVAGNNPPWNLVPIEPSDPMYRMALDYWSARALGQIVKPEPQPLPGAPAPVWNQYAQTHAAPAAVGAGALPVNYGPVPTPPAAPNDQAAAFAAWQAQQAQAAQHVTAPAMPYNGAVQAAPVASISPVPAGVNMPPEIWATLTDGQRAQIVASVHAPAAPVNATANPY